MFAVQCHRLTSGHTLAMDVEVAKISLSEKLKSSIALDWVEKKGPKVRRPRRFGFGSRLISLVIERQLNGEVHRTFGREGLSVRMIVPLTHERWPGLAKAMPASAADA